LAGVTRYGIMRTAHDTMGTNRARRKASREVWVHDSTNWSTAWRLARVLVLGTTVIASSFAITTILPSTHPTVAEASVASGNKDNDKNDKDQKDKHDKGGDHDEDHVLNGQVIDMDTLKDPPVLMVGGVDGVTVVRVLKTDEIAINGVGLGDYVQATGEKQNEQLFDATELSVSEHFSDVRQENDNKKK